MDYKLRKVLLEKCAILSDIHSNVFALDAVAKDTRSKNVIAFINLNDILYFPIAPKEIYDYLQSLGA